ncbi:MAG: hypothetical protein ACRD0K_29320, partial [Egibacteraceae bacterium]
EGRQGDLALTDEQGNQSVHIDGGGGNLTLGGGGHNADIRMLDEKGGLTIHLDGGTGDVIVNGMSLTPADFVLAADYALPSLGDVLSFIRRHGHLPDLRSGEEMKAKGINLVEFTMTLLRKVEELTLYLIKQDDVVRQQQRRLEQVEKHMRQNP